ncbi:WD40-repeat-containing domain protein, partial [Thamnocephalis sphaerospora]
GIGIVSMLFRTNYLALTGGGRDPKFSPNNVTLWDDSKEKDIVKLEFRSEVKNVKLRRPSDQIIVVLANKVYVYTFSAQPKRLHMFETPDNEKGLVAVSTSKSLAVLAFPGRQPGHIQVVDLGQFIAAGTASVSSVTTPLANMTISSSIIAAHTAALGCLAMNAEGTLLASASDKGTLIRVFEALSGKLLHELRRGADRAEIYSIAFSADSTRLCVSSDKGTVHVFNLDAASSGAAQRSSSEESARLAFMKDLLPKYFSSEWSFAHCQLPTDSRCICAFGPERNTIIVVCADGGCYKFTFDPIKGGECIRESYNRFLR